MYIKKHFRIACQCQYSSPDSQGDTIKHYLNTGITGNMTHFCITSSSSYMALQLLYRVLALSTNFFHPLLSWARVFQFGTFIFCIFCITCFS